MGIRFEWDKAKNRQNIKKHGFDLSDARDLFSGNDPLFVSPDISEAYGEERGRASASCGK